MTKKKESLIKIIWKFILIVFGMTGIRFDKGRYLVFWIPLVFLSYLLNHFVNLNNWWVAYTIFSWAFYYVGNSLIMITPIRSWMIKKLGKEEAYSTYCLIVGLMFLNSGLASVQVAVSNPNTLSIPSVIIWPISIIVFVISFGSKFWATWLAGLDIYYYKDLFLNEKIGKFISIGPYKIFKNPMYGVGNIYSYLSAFIMQSLEGLVVALIFHISIYLFYYLIERSFVKRIFKEQKVSNT